jgi:hypothetical protein
VHANDGGHTLELRGQRAVRHEWNRFVKANVCFCGL